MAGVKRKGTKAKDAGRVKAKQEKEAGKSEKAEFKN
jgi:hypothetical protein